MTSAPRAATLADHLNRMSSSTDASARMASARGFDDSRAEQETFVRGRQARTQRAAHFEDDPQDAGLATSDATTTPAKPSQAGRPSLEQQVANLQYRGDWDDTTTALLKMVAAKLYSQDVTLCPDCDNDHFLAKLIAFDWSSEFRSAPTDLRRFAWKVATELECNPHDYHAVLDGVATSTEVAPSRSLDHGTSASGVLANLATNVIQNVVQKAIIEALPLSREIKGAKAFYERLRSIYEGNYTPQRQLEELADALDALRDTLTARGSESWAEPRTLKGYLDVVTPWLRSVSTQWMNVELSVDEVRNTESMLGKMQGVLDLTEKLLATPQLARVMAADTLSGLGQGVREIRQTLSQVQQWQALPGDARLDDYLGIVVANPLVKKILDESTLELGRVLAQVQRDKPYPSDRPLSARLAWLAGTLTDPALREQVQPRVAMVLGDERANQLFAIFQLVDQLRHFPTDSSLGAQALWLLAQLKQHAGDTPALAWLNQFQAALGADPATVSLVNRLLTFNQSPESRLSLMRDLSKAVAPSLGELALRQVGGQLLPMAMARELEKFWQNSSATESWASLFQRLANSAWTITKPYVAGALMNDPLAAATVQYAEALQQHTSWEETLRWFATHDPSQDKTLQLVYGQYLNAVLVWQVYQALNSGDPNETEGKLRQLALQLKDYQLVKSYPQLEKLIDLIPLLPALHEAQKTVRVQPSADSWLGWVNQWLEALADSTSPSLVKLRDELSRKVENWLADGMMSAFDAAAQLPSRLLPGAVAASVPPDTRAAGGTTVPATEATGLGANWQLGAGIGLEALGVAAIGYAIWQWRQAGRAEAVPARDIEMQEVSVPQSTEAQSQSEVASFLPPDAATVTLAAQPSLPDRKLPLLLGVAGVGAMAAGGAFLHRWAASGTGAAAQDGFSDSEYQRELHIISELQVPSLDFLFYGEPLVEEAPQDRETTTPREGAARTTKNETTFVIQKSSRVRRSAQAQFDSESIRRLIDDAKRDAGLHKDNILDALSSTIDKSPDIRRLYGRPRAEINVMYLLKFIENISYFIGNLDRDRKEKYRTLLDGLWRIADGLTDEYGQSKVAEYKRAFLIRNRSQQWGETGGVSATAEPSTSRSQSVENAEDAGERALQKLEMLYSPILNPSDFIDDYIKKAIISYEESSGKKLSLTPESKITVHVTTQVHNRNYGRPGAGGQDKFIRQVAGTRTYSLKEIVTGHYLYDLNLIAKGDTTRKVTFDNSDAQHLVDEIKKVNLQTKMEQALHEYRNDPEKRSGLTSHYQGMMKLRCMEYLDSRTNVPLYREAVEKFLTGEIQAREVAFNGVKLNGVFQIPDGEAGGLLFSVDEPTFFHVGSGKSSIQDINGRHLVQYYPTFPGTDAFKNWVLRKIPCNMASRYEDASVDLFSGKLRMITNVHGFADLIMVTPFSFAASANSGDLADKLFDGLMDRLESDVDTLVFSSGEQITEAALNVAKTILILGAGALNVAVPGSGTPIGRIALFLANLALDAGYVAISAAQAAIADRPEDAAAFRNDAILAGVLGGVISVARGIPVTRQEVSQTLELYRNAKAASSKTIPVLLRKMNWNRLADNRKIDLLVDTMKNSAPARELAGLTNSEVVEQSIRRNLTLDGLGDVKSRFAWGDYASEQTQVHRRLTSDLARVKDANGRMNRFMDQPPAVPRESLPGTPENAAAGWIARNSRSAAAPVDGAQLQSRVRDALALYRRADLLDIQTIDRIHEAVYAPAPGQAERTFRSSSDPVFMGSDIARVGFERALNDIRNKGKAVDFDLGEALYAAITRYHPYGDGNGRTARTVYALAQLKMGPRGPFRALTKTAEDMLNPPIRPVSK
ncbi:Fic family protein [Burkholderia ubonensis]|uniref:Fic family protein n=1 Tax=Burkholderia ubonensis TaxID=101571 RepID=UPI0012FA3324|nr:Fic family protein [Burkholderia ubonensis]